jgi:ubiquinone/menaquinone biosynthesis C-methylase UbiE
MPERLVVCRAVLCLLAALCAAAGAPAEERSVSPGVNAPYENADYAQWQERFERPGREVYDRREAIVEAAGITAGMTVADVGAGTGLFVRPFARAVGEAGKVYAVDITPEFIERIRAFAAAEGLRNVEAVLNDDRDVALPGASVDLAFLCDVYHHFEYPADMMASIRRALRPGGRLVVIDFKREEGISEPWILEHVRTGRDDVVAEIEAAGFRLIGERAILDQNYYLLFEKPS